MHLPPVGHDEKLVAATLDDALARGARTYAISGLQGSGKSTLAARLAAAAQARGVRAVALSIDDFYLDRDARLALAREVHPLLATRGPPGTHDLALALDTLDALQAGRATALPRFDKLADRRLPRRDWQRVQAIDLVVLEGWCLGTPPEDDGALDEPLNALERDEDRDGRWRRWCNAALARDYPALWRRCDRLLLLQAPSFDIVPEWRWQAERALHATRPTRVAMDRAGVDRFVQHFERVSRQALRMLPALADVVVALDEDRRPC